ncbi:hypothetical protein [Azospirillum canadense]|uniref:hypothetical protein n=1 Tax=Azospirillum canadense TaxID=403962 RepID=UPI002227FD88|nr:hypothetical protein [Azospirillum canadense]MCW2239692.1 hypothetical protein [Azospirillum canadense]
MASRDTDGVDLVQRGRQRREVVAVFDDPDCLDGAISELQQHGFGRADLSTVCNARMLEAELGHVCTDVREIEDNPSAPRSVFVSKASIGDAEGALVGVAVYIGAIAAAGMTAAAGASMMAVVVAVAIGTAITGGAGYALMKRLDRRYNASIQEQLERGGLILWVHLHSEEQERDALKILSSCSAKRLHVHEVPIR